MGIADPAASLVAVANTLWARRVSRLPQASQAIPASAWAMGRIASVVWWHF
jgi:hypothetical protein